MSDEDVWFCDPAAVEQTQTSLAHRRHFEVTKRRKNKKTIMMLDSHLITILPATPQATQKPTNKMEEEYTYPSIPGTQPLDYELKPATGDNEPLPQALTHPNRPVRGGKSVFAFWHSGIDTLPPYLRRNVISWYRRLAPLGWTVYVLDSVPDSPLSISRYLDTTSSSVVPAAYTDGRISGTYAHQHASDLIRYPLLLAYGGVYMDVGILLFGDLDRLWSDLLVNPDSACEFAGFTMGGADDPTIVNFAFACLPDNPLVARAHRILLGLWKDGDRTDTVGMHRHPLVDGVPLMRVPSDTKQSGSDGAGGGGRVDAITDESMTDYAIQIQAMSAAQRWVDPSDGWDGPRYVREKTWLLGMLDGANIPDQLAGWDGKRLFDLLSLQIPRDGEIETEDHKLAREMVERTVSDSLCFKLSHGFTAKLFGGDTVGMLWRKHVGSDAVPGTYAGWMRWAMASCKQDRMLEPIEVPVYEPSKVARLDDFIHGRLHL